jgi:hypothetical protein
MMGGLSLLSVITAAITSGFVSRAAAQRRASGDDPVIQKLDQLAQEVAALRADINARRAGSDADKHS